MDNKSMNHSGLESGHCAEMQNRKGVIKILMSESGHCAEVQHRS